MSTISVIKQRLKGPKNLQAKSQKRHTLLKSKYWTKMPLWSITERQQLQVQLWSQYWRKRRIRMSSRPTTTSMRPLKSKLLIKLQLPHIKAIHLRRRRRQKLGNLRTRRLQHPCTNPWLRSWVRKKCRLVSQSLWKLFWSSMVVRRPVQLMFIQLRMLSVALHMFLLESLVILPPPLHLCINLSLKRNIRKLTKRNKRPNNLERRPICLKKRRLLCKRKLLT